MQRHDTFGRGTPKTHVTMLTVSGNFCATQGAWRCGHLFVVRKEQKRQTSPPNSPMPPAMNAPGPSGGALRAPSDCRNILGTTARRSEWTEDLGGDHRNDFPDTAQTNCPSRRPTDPDCVDGFATRAQQQVVHRRLVHEIPSEDGRRKRYRKSCCGCGW